MFCWEAKNKQNNIVLYLALQPVFIRNKKTFKMPDYLGNDMRKTKDEKEAEEKDIKRKLVC